MEILGRTKCGCKWYADAKLGIVFCKRHNKKWLNYLKGLRNEKETGSKSSESYQMHNKNKSIVK